jgi:translation initiation factor 3 subunit C
MSRFFTASDSSSDESSDEELYSGDEAKSEAEDSDQSDSDESGDDNDSDSSSGEEKGAKYFLRNASESSDSEEEEERKGSKSGKDKRFDELEKTIQLIDNAERINDWAVINTGMCSYVVQARLVVKHPHWEPEGRLII